MLGVTALFLIMLCPILARITFTPGNFHAGNKDRPRFSEERRWLSTFDDITQRENKRFRRGSVVISY